MILTSIILLTPFIQLGFSYYGSVAMLALILNMWNWRAVVLRSLIRYFYLLFVIVLMLPSLTSYHADDFERNVARIFREGVIFFALVSMVKTMPFAPLRVRPERLEKPVFLVVAGLLALVIVQTIAFTKGIYIGFPETAYMSELGTIPDELSLYWVEQRPNGTFGEPSYLGFVMLSFMLMFLPVVRRSRAAMAIVIIAVLVGLLSRSLSFTIAAALVGVWPTFQHGRPIVKVRLAAAIGALALLALTFTGAGDVLGRLSGGASSSGDYSSFVRIFAPLTILPKFLIQYPFGVPLYDLVGPLRALNPDPSILAEEYSNNGIFNLLFGYGFVGFLLIAVLARSSKDIAILIYLFTSGMFNGAFLAVDKLAVILLAVGVYEANKRRAMEPTSEVASSGAANRRISLGKAGASV